MSEEFESIECTECQCQIQEGDEVICEACEKVICEDCKMTEGEDNVIGGNAITLCTDCYAENDHCHICGAVCESEEICSSCDEHCCSNCSEENEDEEVVCEHCKDED